MMEVLKVSERYKMLQPKAKNQKSKVHEIDDDIRYGNIAA